MYVLRPLHYIALPSFNKYFDLLVFGMFKGKGNDFVTCRKGECDFLLANNSNFGCTLNCFQHNYIAAFNKKLSYR